VGIGLFSMYVSVCGAPASKPMKEPATAGDDVRRGKLGRLASPTSQRP
jgi:hypothetical protein